MSAIYGKELKSYMTSMIGCVFIAFVLLLTGIYFRAYNLMQGYPDLGQPLGSLTFIFLIGTPLLTMRILAEERREKTDQMLLTSPAPVSKIVLGKYFALLTIYLIPIAILCLYPLILGSFGTINYTISYVSILGFFLLGCTSISIGLFISSVTENPVIAAVVTFLVLFICYIISGLYQYLPQTAVSTALTFAVIVLIAAFLIFNFLKSWLVAVIFAAAGEAAVWIIFAAVPTVYEQLLTKILSVFDITSHFEKFINGILDVRGIVYYLSICAVFVILTVQSIQKRRWN